MPSQVLPQHRTNRAGKSLIAKLLVAVTISLSVVGARPQVNLLYDPGFESGSFGNGWYGEYSGSQYSQDYVLTGEWSMKLTAPPSGTCVIYQVPLVPGAGEYRITGWGFTPTGLDQASLVGMVSFWEAPWQNPLSDQTMFIGLPPAPYTPTGVWTSFDSGPLIAPEGTGAAYVLLTLSNSGEAPATLYLDELSLVQVPEPQFPALFGAAAVVFQIRHFRRKAVKCPH